MPNLTGFLVLVSVACALAIDFHPEAACNQKGGICVSSSSCPNTRLEKGLCPEQQSLGAECCHEVPASDKRCSSHGGECITNCPDTVKRVDLECQTGTHCCIWL